MIKLLLHIGLISRRYDGSLHWPVKFAPAHVFRDWRSLRGWYRMHGAFYIFRNRKGVIRKIKGRLLPWRWGFGVFGIIEIGDRGSQHGDVK